MDFQEEDRMSGGDVVLVMCSSICSGIAKRGGLNLRYHKIRKSFTNNKVIILLS
jgi:hypothetical protein